MSNTFFQAYRKGQPVPGLACEFAEMKIAKRVNGSFQLLRSKRIDSYLPNGERLQCSRDSLLADTALAHLHLVAQEWTKEDEATTHQPGSLRAFGFNYTGGN